MYTNSSESSARFSLVGRLYGHTDAINCLAPSGDGAFLASGGIFRFSWLFLFLVHPAHHRTRRVASVGSQISPRNSSAFGSGGRASRRGQVTCVVWLLDWTDAWKLLCFGTTLGYIVLWQETIGVRSVIVLRLIALLDSFMIICSRIAIARCPQDVSGQAVRSYLLLWIPEAVNPPGSHAEHAINAYKYFWSMISGT